jgi:CubicO group peptidase (beta-lactamase class C family)
MPQNVQEHIFDVLGMRSSTYMPQERPELVARRLQMVEREKGSLVADDTVPQDLMISIEDFEVILADLISSQSKLLRKENIALLFTPQFPEGSAALSDLRTNPESLENYTVPAGIPPECKSPLVNYTCAGLYVEDTLPLSHFPKGTTTWNGMPNIIWAINPEKKLAMLFATQLLPVDDEKVVAMAMDFFKCALATFL